MINIIKLNCFSKNAEISILINSLFMEYLRLDIIDNNQFGLADPMSNIQQNISLNTIVKIKGIQNGKRSTIKNR